MGVIDAASDTGFLRQRNHFFRLGEILRRIEQPAGKADRALAHPLDDQLLFLFRLSSVGGAGGLVQYRLPDRAKADIGDSVGALAVAAVMVEAGLDRGRAIAVDANKDGGD